MGILEYFSIKLHRVKLQFGADVRFSKYIYANRQFNWRRLDTIHLMINHRFYSKFAQQSIIFFQQI